MPTNKLGLHGSQPHSQTIGEIRDMRADSLAWSVVTIDQYHRNIKAAAYQLGIPDWIYLTQYASGTTLWRNTETGETRLIKGATC